MMTTYRKEISELSGDELLIKIDAEGKEWWIPADPSNSDYQRYLRWLENPDAEENGTIS
jgi:hypothetical protein